MTRVEQGGGRARYRGVLGAGLYELVSRAYDSMKINSGRKLRPTEIFPRDSNCYRILSMFEAHGTSTCELRNVAAIRGSLFFNLSRILFQETRTPRKTLAKMIARDMGISVPCEDAGLINSSRMEMSSPDVALLDLILSGLGVY